MLVNLINDCEFKIRKHVILIKIHKHTFSFLDTPSPWLGSSNLGTVSVVNYSVPSYSFPPLLTSTGFI
jgi:hypothetical protein